MFSTYFYPYNYFSLESQPFYFYTPTNTNQAFLHTYQDIIPLDCNTNIEVPKQNRLKTFKKQKLIKKQQKLVSKRILMNFQEKNTKNNAQQFSFKTQNSQRNLLSNLLHHLISFILKNSDFKPIMQKIIKVHHLNITCSEIIKFVSKVNLRSYIKTITIECLWSQDNPNQQLSKALRIFSYYFLKQKSFLLVCESKRIKNSTKLQHMQKIRYLIKLLLLS